MAGDFWDNLSGNQLLATLAVAVFVAVGSVRTVRAQKQQIDRLRADVQDIEKDVSDLREDAQSIRQKYASQIPRLTDALERIDKNVKRVRDRLDEMGDGQ
mgnify:FL=1